MGHCAKSFCFLRVFYFLHLLRAICVNFNPLKPYVLLFSNKRNANVVISVSL